MSKDLNVHELVMYAENELETHASKVSLPKLIFFHMNELNSHLIHGVQVKNSCACENDIFLHLYAIIMSL